MENQSVQIPLENLPVRVRQIIVEGTSHTSPKLVYGHLENLSAPSSIGELNDTLHDSLSSLSSTNLFNGVVIDIDKSSAPDAISSDIDVYVKIAEKTKFGVSAGIQQRDYSTVGTFAAHVTNPLFGFGERLDVSVTTDKKVTNPEIKNVSARLGGIRFVPTAKSTFSVAGQKDVIDQSELSSFKGTSETVSVGWTSANHRHNVEYEAGLRQVTPINATSSIISQGLVPSFKSALKYSYRLDQRLPSPIAPTDGYMVTAKLESAGLGLGGDVKFGKAEVLAQKHIPINDAVSLALTGRAGVAQPWNNVVNQVKSVLPKADDDVVSPPYEELNVVDRFFHTTLFVRGVSPREYGPKCGENALGGDLYTAFTASLSTSIPRYEALPVRPHVFANVGNLVSLSNHMIKTANGTAESKCVFANSTLASFGTGVVLPTAMGRIELNYAIPYKKQTGFGQSAFSLGASMDW